MTMDSKKLIELLETMLRIRHFEEEVGDLAARRKILGSVHLYIGEEAVAAGVCANLRQNDFITSTHRGHGHCIAKGGEFRFMMAELFGKTTGYCQGKGGSQHIANFDLGILGANGIVGGGMPIASGAGLSIKMRDTNQVAVCFFGDGCCNNGVFHESLNLASVWNLPVVYVCENNQYALSVPVKQSSLIQDYYLRKDAYGIRGCKVDGNDVIAVYEASKEAVERARKGEGPSLIECKTYRWRGHYEGEFDRHYTYRTKKEIEEWIEKCPIAQFKGYLIENNIITQEKIDQLEKEIQRELLEAVAFAEDSPAPKPEDALAGLFENE
ncbi:thiamine pyrophosphate-dependent enzyme [Desulforhopalus singaporensis]